MRSSKVKITLRVTFSEVERNIMSHNENITKTTTQLNINTHNEIFYSDII